MRNAVAIGVFLFGTTFLWLTPAMSGKTAGDLSGGLWSAVQLLAWVTIVVFSSSAWAIYKSHDWWLPAVLAAAVLGLAVTAVYMLAARDTDGVANVASNVAIHFGVSLLILAVVAVPQLRDRVSHRLT